MSTNLTYQLSNLLEKMQSTDKDFRFMATNDLMVELQKDAIKLDDDSERKIVRMLLKLLEDKNGEVQNLAVKCLGPLVMKVKEAQVETIVDTLCSNMISDKEQLRDISSIGLKTVISELPASQSGLIAAICKKISGRLTTAIGQKGDITVQLEALDILSDLLNRFGTLLVQYHPSIQAVLLPQLESQRLAVRKRSITALSYLLVSCSQTLFNKTIDALLTDLSNNGNSKTPNISAVRTHIQCIAAISRQAGHRFGEHLERVMPLVIHFCAFDDDELKEYCLQAFESFVRRCPKEIKQHVRTIIGICLKYVSYDPNYNYDDADDEDMEMDNEEENDSNDEYSDDDDMSWKVRRASAKCLEAVISTRHDMVMEFYTSVSPALIARYKEREENVKVDIFNAYIALLKQTRAPVGSSVESDMDHSENPISLLSEQVKDIVKSLHKQLREKSVKTRQGSFALLNELIHVLPGSLLHDAATLIPGILYSLSDKNSSSNMKIDALAFLNAFIKSHQADVFQPHIQTLLPAIITAVGDSFYKISSEALLVLTQVVKVIRPEPQSAFNFKPYIKPIYDCTLTKLRATDIDQEVKERAITCMGQIISVFGDNMKAELSTSLPLLVDRLRNEITRLTCVKALSNIASSPFKINLDPLLPEAFNILASFLRKNQRALKLCTLALLDILAKNYGEYISPQVINTVVSELPALINESDLHISQLTLVLLTTLTRFPAMQDVAVIPQQILPQTLVLVRSPLLQGAALQSVLDFFQALVRSSFPGLDYVGLVNQLTIPIYHPTSSPGTLHKQAYHSIAKCVASITITDVDHSLATVQNYLQSVSKASEQVQTFVYLTIGEIGKNVDLSRIPQLKQCLVTALSSQSEEVKSAASFALGSVSVGNLQEYLPFVLQQIETGSKRQYLLLHSLKEIISCQSVNTDMVDQLKPHLDSIWALLLNHCECPEEGTRNVVAECLGKLTLMNPEILLPKLQGYLQHNSHLARSTVVTALKFTISDQPQRIDSLLKSCIGEFLKTLQDSDINVRRVALVMFNSAAHNKPSLIRDLLPSTMPQLYNETNVRPELIREVEMGPFKHTVDDGLDIRKAAFECMYTLLDSCLDRIDIFEFLNHVENGLRDHYDIKMLTYLMLVRLSVLCPSSVLNRIDRLVEPLKTTCGSKVKANAVKQEYEKQDELKRSALRACLALLAIPDADKNPQMVEFLSQIKSSAELKELFDQIQKDGTSIDHATPMEL
ncbi:Cullin-associated Nedd8-dissociated protein 1 [Halotydeus destructor]|nr:Cullin-associated Nedd8-dissociated protein 1 [Halotydeus destructor]